MKSSVNPRGAIAPKIVGYCLSDDKKAVLMEIARELNINMNLVGTESAGRLVGSLVAINGVKSDIEKVENPPECEVLIMSGLKSSVLDKLLKLLREKGALIDLKCIVTPENQNWRVFELIKELKAEHERLHN